MVNDGYIYIYIHTYISILPQASEQLAARRADHLRCDPQGPCYTYAEYMNVYTYQIKIAIRTIYICIYTLNIYIYI